MEDKKICSHCHVNLPLTHFSMKRNTDFNKMCDRCLVVAKNIRDRLKCIHLKRKSRCNICNVKGCLRKSVVQRMYAVLGYSDFDYLCCDMNEYMEYLEEQFTEEMNWGNYCTVWQIDHILPIGRKDISITERINRLVYLNTRPLLIIDNLRKHCKE